MNSQTLYDTDFNSWIQQHIILLKQGRFNEIDAQHLIEELEDMSKSQQRELISRLIILIAHLLKWHYQPQMRSNSWESTISEQRAQIDYLLDDMPSLKKLIPESVIKAYDRAVKLASKETKLALSKFPNECSYTIKELLDEDFYPNNTTE